MQYIMIKHNYPKEIIEFMDNIFEIHEIRGTVGNVNGVYFHIRTNEQNHVLPHIHAKYGEYWISIEINSGKILDGNLPNKQQKKAVEWLIKYYELFNVYISETDEGLYYDIPYSL